MKNLSDYLQEKKEQDKKAPLKKDAGADDKKFMALMVEYKTLRKSRDDKEAAAKVLKKALELGKNGDVSSKAKTAAAYL